MYEFQGTCEYFLAISGKENKHRFAITAENVPCGTTGVTCTKSIKLDIGERGTVMILYSITHSRQG
jgi:hypothetical protein